MSYPKVLSEPTTLHEAHMGRSLARFGDGELKICQGRSAKSQPHDAQLSAILRRILVTTDGPCLPCIPRITKEGPKWEFWREFTMPPWIWLYKATAGAYGSSFITRPDSAPEIDNAGYWASLTGLWAGRDVVLVRGSTKSLIADRLPGAASVHEIVAPTQNAWQAHRELFTRLRKEKRRVILCLGATATALAWMLAEEGVHALDLGHVGMFLKRLGEDGTVGAKRRNDKD